MRLTLKAVVLGMCAIVPIILLEKGVERLMPAILIGGFLEEGVKIAFALCLLTRGDSKKKAMKIAGWVGFGFFFIETLCFILAGRSIIGRVGTLIGHILWPVVGISFSRIFLGIIVAGALHQTFNFGALIVANGAVPTGVSVVATALIVTILIAKNRFSKLS